jgi:hypothetical protein
MLHDQNGHGVVREINLHLPCIQSIFATTRQQRLLNLYRPRCERENMIAPVVHRRWAREYLARAERTPQPDRKRRYLRLAVSNTVCAHRLEAQSAQPSAAATSGHEEKGSAVIWLTPKR